MKGWSFFTCLVCDLFFFFSSNEWPMRVERPRLTGSVPEPDDIKKKQPEGGLLECAPSP